MDGKNSSQSNFTDPMNVRLLARIPLFEKLPEDELHHLAKSLRVREIPPNTLLFREGDVGDNFYIVIYGEIEVVKALGTEDERLIAVRGQGEFVGEISMIHPEGLRMATIRSRGPAQLWEMTHAEFDSLLARQPGLAYEMLRVLSARLTEAHNSTIHDLQEKNRELVEAYDELKAAQAQIIEKERLERELQVAYEIQMSILPQTLPSIKGYDFGACIVPARAVGGDFYDLIRFSPDRVGVFIGDVADKGVPSAIFMARTHALIYAEASRCQDPAEVLRQVNRHLQTMSEPGLFVTVLYGLLNRNTGEFSYARAGHELPIVGSGEIEPHLAPWKQGQLIGMLENPLIDEQTIVIPPGGVLLLYTDGVTDGRNPKGEAFGIEQVLHEIRSLAGLPAQEICDRLLGGLIKYQGDARQDDDITVVAIHSSVQD
jgi:sigma-B regulation protein RsbU (phosphoserine phosphatase)